MASILPWRVFVNEQKELPLVDDALSIQVQFRDRGPANRGEANNHRIVIAPGEMLVPVMFSRMKERD